MRAPFSHRQILRWGIDLDRPREQRLMASRSVAEIMSPDFLAVGPDCEAAVIKARIRGGRAGEVFVAEEGTRRLLGIISLSTLVGAGDDATAGAAIRIDGEPSGNVPLRKTLPAGRHLVQVGKRGYVTFSKWVDLTAGQVLNIPVVLQPQAVKTGSLLVTADVAGLPVLIDGQDRGRTPLVVDGLSEGDHVVDAGKRH